MAAKWITASTGYLANAFCTSSLIPKSPCTKLSLPLGAMRLSASMAPGLPREKLSMMVTA